MILQVQNTLYSKLLCQNGQGFSLLILCLTVAALAHTRKQQKHLQSLPRLHILVVATWSMCT